MKWTNMQMTKNLLDG